MKGYPLLDAFLTIFWLFIWIMWIFLLIRVISDVFRSHDLSGPGKAGWTLVLIFFPLIGVLVYLLARGGGMHTRETRQAQASEETLRDYLNRSAGTTGSTADELHRLADLRDRGVLTEEEFQRLKARLVG
jgi:ABC-type multidrug transport system fused ATPase/permease subunit